MKRMGKEMVMELVEILHLRKLRPWIWKRVWIPPGGWESAIS